MRPGPGEGAFQVQDQEVCGESSPSARRPPGDRLEGAGGRGWSRAGEEQRLVDVEDPTPPVVQDHGPHAAQSGKPTLGFDVEVHSQSSVVRVHFPADWMQVAPASTRCTPVAKNAPQNTGSASW